MEAVSGAGVGMAVERMGVGRTVAAGTGPVLAGTGVAAGACRAGEQAARNRQILVKIA